MKKIFCLLLILLVCLSSHALAAPGKSWTKTAGAELLTFTEVDGVSNVRQFLGFYEGVAGFEQNGLWGAIDTEGNLLFEACWDEMTIYSEGLAGVKKDGLWGCIDKQGNVVIEPQWAMMESTFSHGLRAVSKGSLWGYIDTTGAVIIEPQFLQARSFSEGLAAVKTRSGWGYIDTTGSFVIDPQWQGGLSASDQKNFGSGKNYEGSQIYGSFDDAGSFCAGRAVVSHGNNRYSLIDQNGNAVIANTTMEMMGFDPLSDGLMLVYDGGIGFMDTQGNMVIPINSRWGSGFGFCEGYANVAEVKRKGYSWDYTWYYIDREGKRLGSRTWDWAWSFLGGKAIVQKGNKVGYIDSTGELLFDMEAFGFITDFVDGYAMVLRNGKMVIIHSEPLADALARAAAANGEPGGSAQFVLITHTSRVNVRADSNSDSSRVGMADSGKTYPCLGVAENGWLQIMLDNGTVGYISGKMGKLIP